MNLLQDIYYQKEYAALYAKEAELFEFEYIENDLVFKNLAIKKPITRISRKPITEGYYDLETPYGYGGYYANTTEEGFVARALAAYKKKCLDENIIAEFVRFHPFNEFPAAFGAKLNFCALDRQVMILDLSLSDEERWKNYGGTTRNILRKGQSQLAISQTKDIQSFMTIYNETMDRNKAADFYYFEKEYYKNLLAIPGVVLLKIDSRPSKGDSQYLTIDRDETFDRLGCGGLVAMGFMMFGKDIAHYHLSANKAENMKLNANYIMLDSAFEMAKKRGCKYFLLGGGRTNSPDDPLLKFKQKFTSLTKDFYIAGNVINEQKYTQYVKIYEEQQVTSDVKYFLKYRL